VENIQNELKKYLKLKLRKNKMVNEEEIKKLTEEIVERIVKQQNLDISSKNCSQTGGICVLCNDPQCITRNKPAVDNILKAGADRLSTNLGVTPEAANLAKMIDHTLLKPEATISQIKNLCTEAKKYGFASVCVNPCYVSLCKEELKGTDVKVCTVVGFPLGATTTETKSFETRDAIANGADEIDMVINIGFLKSKNYLKVEDDIRAVVEAAKGATVKVIIETALLTDEEKVKACQIAKSAKANFVKTSTGFAKTGATVYDVQLMRRTVGPKMGVKAAGGIKTFEDAQSMVKAGATRIGSSASVAILKSKEIENGY
jgi:deoxyribose-phosphate aldolase